MMTRLAIAFSLAIVSLTGAPNDTDIRTSNGISDRPAVHWVLMSQPLRTDVAIESGKCGWCEECAPNWSKMEANEHENGISETQPCVEDLCRIRDVCAPTDAQEEDHPPTSELDVGLVSAGVGSISRRNLLDDRELSFATDIARIWNAAVAESVPDILRYVELYPDRVFLNDQRRAVQAVGCSGLVILSVPLPDATFLRVRKALP